MSEKAMAPHSGTLAWRIPGMGEPGGLPSMGSHWVGHDWSDLVAASWIKLVEVRDSSWAISNPKRWCCESAALNMPVKLENSAVVTGLEKVSFHSKPKVAQMVKCLPAMQKTWVWSLGWKDLLEKETATHSSTLTWRIPWTEEPGRLQSLGHKEMDMTEQLHLHFHMLEK